MKKKPYISVSSSDGLDAYRVILVTYISAAYITEQLKRNNGVTFAPFFFWLFVCVGLKYKKEKGNCFYKIVLCFMIERNPKNRS